MRILSIVGARPQFVKLAVVHHAIAARANGGSLRHIIVHTGQHYDAAMSGVFFEELAIPRPDADLEVGSGSHGEQTGEMLKRLEPVLAESRPDWVLLYGDTNSTLAGAVAASKLHQKIAHVEAGLRSFNRAMPEEINRVVADHLSDLLLCPTEAAVDNLRREGLAGRAVRTGDVMFDAFQKGRREAEARAGSRWPSGGFALATIHRAENTDDPSRLARILRALERVAAEISPVLLPLHPRTRKRAAEVGWTPIAVQVTDPVSYFDMVLLESRARMILTDSGGVQKEAYFARRPCITLRDETEWVETQANGCNQVVGADEERILDAVRAADSAGPWSDLYGDGDAGGEIVEALLRR